MARIKEIWIIIVVALLTSLMSVSSFAANMSCVAMLESVFILGTIPESYKIMLNRQFATMGRTHDDLDQKISDDEIRTKLLEARSSDNKFEYNVVALVDPSGTSQAHFNFRIVPDTDVIIADSIYVVPAYRKSGVSDYLLGVALSGLPHIKRILFFLDETNLSLFKLKPEASPEEKLKLTPAYHSFTKYGFSRIWHISETDTIIYGGLGFPTKATFPQVILSKPD